MALPPGFGATRGRNWSGVGRLDTSFHLCRYNLSSANQAVSDEFYFSKETMGDILTAFFFASACGEVINGLSTGRLGGKQALLIGAVAIAVAFVRGAFTANSTHALLGLAAAMDIGGRKAAAFASGCINSF